MRKEKQDLIAEMMPFFELALSVMAEKIKSDLLAEMDMQPPVKKLFYNLRELEVVTGITYLGLKGRIKRGTLMGVKSGNVWLVSTDEVTRFVNQLHHQKRA